MGGIKAIRKIELIFVSKDDFLFILRILKYQTLAF